MKLIIENKSEQINNSVPIETVRHTRFVAETKYHGTCFFYKREVAPSVWFMIGESASVYGVTSASAGFPVWNPRPAEISEIKVSLA